MGRNVVCGRTALAHEANGIHQNWSSIQEAFHPQESWKAVAWRRSGEERGGRGVNASKFLLVSFTCFPDVCQPILVVCASFRRTMFSGEFQHRVNQVVANFPQFTARRTAQLVQ
jgi:hypothetical protein